MRIFNLRVLLRKTQRNLPDCLPWQKGNREREGMGGRDPESRYWEHIRHEQKVLEEYAAYEIEWADDLLWWYRAKGVEIPDDQYRAAVFFKNREYLRKPGALTLLYSMYRRCMEELPPPTKEIAFDLVAYRYKVYAVTLEKGGYDGGEDRG
jgi:hypothetical protein